MPVLSIKPSGKWSGARTRGGFTSGNGVAAFALTTQVVAEPTWTPELLERRQETLIRALAKEWDLLAPAPVVSATA